MRIFKCWRMAVLLGLLALFGPVLDGFNPDPGLAQQPVTLTLAHPTWFGDYDRYLNRYIPEFERRMADEGRPVKIEVVELPAPDDPYREALLLRLGAGQAPDIWMEDTFWIPADSTAGFLLDLTDRVQAWEWDRWVEAAKGAVTFGGRVWGLNRDTDVRPLYYRKDIFAEAGLPVPWQPRGWMDLLSAAVAIKEKVPNVIPIAFKAGTLGGEATTMQGFYMLLLGAGGRLFDQETGKWVTKSQALRETLEFYQIIFGTGLSTDPEFWLAGKPVDKIHLLLSNVDPTPDNPALAMLVTWDGVWFDTANPEHERYIPDPPGRDAVLAYTKMPALAPGQGIRGQDFVTISGGWSEVCNANLSGEKADLCWEWLKYVYSKDEIRDHLLEEGGALPARVDVAEDPEWVEVQPEYTLWRASELVPLTTFRPGLPEYPEISEAVQEATDKILLGEDVEAVLQFYADRVTQIAGPENTIEKP